MLAITSPHQLIAEQFNARQNELSATRELARAVLRDGGGFHCVEVSEAELSDLTDRAQRYLDENGQDGGDFVALVDELDARLNGGGYGQPDEDAYWRDSHYAEARGLAA